MENQFFEEEDVSEKDKGRQEEGHETTFTEEESCGEEQTVNGPCRSHAHKSLKMKEKRVGYLERS